MSDRMEKPDADWRKELTPEQYEVTRRKGTEPAFTGEYWDCKTPGTYRCICCGTELFKSDAKYDSGTGWPSFWDAIDPAKVKIEEDRSHGMSRTEVMCARCGAHLGHLFDDR